MKNKKADAADYVPWDLVRETPLVQTDSTGGAQPVVQAQRLVGVEFRRDVYPLLVRSCASCHTSAGAVSPPSVGGVAPKLSIFDSTQSAGFAKEVRAYRALARAPANEFSYGTTVPAGQTKYWFPQMSRYVRALQARASLLTWRVYGARLDGRTNGSFPLTSTPASEDLDYSTGTCPAPSKLSPAEKRTIARWIDLGCPIDLDRPRQRYTMDGLSPVLTAEVRTTGTALELRVGVVDVESGVD